LWIGFTKTCKNDITSLRIRYIRFVDDILFGITGPRSLVIKIKNNITNFVENKLKLKMTSGKITRADLFL
jgi:hypothetical protein